MFKKSLLSFVLFALATQAHGLGLGNLSVKSYLEEPLDVSLPLIVTPKDDLNTLVASIASETEFASAGILRQSFVNDLIFEVVRNDGVNPHIRITSKQSIKDPFLHLLIRFEWNSGELLREYTALIDPPIYASESPTPIASPKSIGEDVINDSADSVIASSNTVTSQANNTSIQGFDSDTYGPVVANESLSMIAEQIQDRYPNLSIYQIMYVLYRNNKDAFIDDNINQLIKGSLLSVGDAADIDSIDINDGKALFYEHLSRWTGNAVSDQQNSSEGIKVSDGSSADSDVTTSESQPNADTATGQSEEFKVGSSDLQSASQLSGASSSGEDVAFLEQKLSETESKLSSSVLENNDLQERISLLEEQLSDVNKLLELQSSAGAQIVEGLNTDENPTEEKLVESQQSQNENEIKQEAKQEAERLEAERLEAERERLEAERERVEAERERLEAEKLATTEIKETDSKSVIKEIPSVIEPEKKTLSFLDQAKDTLVSLWKPILGSLGALLLGLIGFAVARKRRSEEEFEESVSGISDMTLDTKAGNSTTVSSDFKTAETTVTKESSFLTVYNDSEVVVHADEIDPIAEADVYIAYGRDEQGEEVLLEGIRKFPNRPDIKVSLLKLHMKRKDVTKFDALAEELYAAGENDNLDVWDKVVEMGAVLSPNNPLYSSNSNKQISSEKSEIGQIDLSSDVASSGVAATAAAAAATTAIAAAASEAEPLLDENSSLDLKLDNENIQSEITKQKSILSDEASIDDEISINTVEADVTVAEVIEGDGVEVVGLDEYNTVDFDNFSVDENTEASINEASINIGEEMSEVSISDDANYDALEEDDLDIASSIEFDNYDNVTEVEVDLSKNEFFERSTQEIVEEAIAKEVTRDVDLEPNIEGDGVDFDEPLSIQLEDVTLDVVADAEVADPNTQLELAKVFVELDDVSGAKEILETLVDTNDADIKKEAIELLKSLG